jgi:rubrerythrin
MSQDFNADQVFGIGVEIERNGKEFYIAASKAAAGASIKKTLLELAQWEAEHVAIFTNLRKGLPKLAKDDTWDPNNEMALYLKASADNHVFVKNIDPKDLVKKCESAKDVMDIAMGLEKDSVVYYSAMKAVVPENQGRGEIETIIGEELKHIALISKILIGLR